MKAMQMAILVLLFQSMKNYGCFIISNKKILESFNDVLDYYVENPGFIGLSGVFGLVRTKAILIDVPQRHENFNIIHTFEDKYKDIMKTKEKILMKHNAWVKNITHFAIWRKRISYKWLEEKCAHYSKNQTKQLLDKLRNEAETACVTPEMFDFCANNSYITKSHNGNDQACRYFFFGDYKGIGYETTHKLLFIQISKLWKYYPKSQQALIDSLCRYIYLQAVATQGNFLFFDLLLEQIFLCGVEGYREFLNTKWLKKVLDNQLEEGCFPLFSRKINFNNSSVKNYCSDHATGLALATLALHIHFRSQNYPISDQREE